MKNLSNKIQLKKILIFSFLFIVLSAPILSFADDASLVPCSNTATVNDDGTIGAIPDGQTCDWDALLKLVNNVINFILFKMLVPIAAIMFSYCGFLLLTAGGESGKKTTAKKIFSNVVWGLVIAVAAWLIVETLLTLLGYQGAWIGF